MLKTSIYNKKAEKVKDVELPEKVFGKQLNESLVHQALVAQMANERKVLAHTKERADVSGGGRKPWRQKGTGRARAGSSRSPIWIGGGVTFGPLKNKNFSKSINQKMKRSAMFMALSDKLSENRFAVLENIDLENFKTKDFDLLLKDFEKKILKDDASSKTPKSDSEQAGKEKKEKENKKTTGKRSIILVDTKSSDKDRYSARNLPGVKLLNLDNINIVDLLKYKNLIITVEAVKEIAKRYK